jgi:hypothetical protein
MGSEDSCMKQVITKFEGSGEGCNIQDASDNEVRHNTF